MNFGRGEKIPLDKQYAATCNSPRLGIKGKGTGKEKIGSKESITMK